MTKYNENERILLSNFTKHGTRQLATSTGDQYNRFWTFRQYQISECRVLGIARLWYSPTDTVSMLPGPDQKGVRKKLGAKRTLQQLYKQDGCVHQPEYVCLSYCLNQGQFRSSCVRQTKKVIAGRCVKCARDHRTRHMRRIIWKHKAPAAF